MSPALASFVVRETVPKSETTEPTVMVPVAWLMVMSPRFATLALPVDSPTSTVSGRSTTGVTIA